MRYYWSDFLFPFLFFPAGRVVETLFFFFFPPRVPTTLPTTLLSHPSSGSERKKTTFDLVAIDGTFCGRFLLASLKELGLRKIALISSCQPVFPCPIDSVTGLAFLCAGV